MAIHLNEFGMPVAAGGGGDAGVVAVSSGGIVIAEAEGRISIGSGVIVSGIVLDGPGERIYAYTNAYVTDTVIATGDPAADDAHRANISLIGSGASGSGVAVGLGGAFNLFSGGVVSDVSIVSGGVFTNRDGCLASGVTVSGGFFHVSGGGTHNTVLTSGSIALDGGTLSGVTVSGGRLNFSGGTIADLELADSGRIDCIGGDLPAEIVVGGGSAYIHPGRTAVAPTVSGSGSIFIQPGATVSDATFASGGGFTVSSGALLSGGTIHTPGVGVSILPGGVVEATAVKHHAGAAASLNIYGGTLSSVTLDGGGGNLQLWWRLNGSALAKDCIVVSKARLQPQSSAVMSGGTVGVGGSCFLFNGGRAIKTEISGIHGGDVPGGSMHINSGCVASNCRVLFGGTIVVSSGGSVVGGGATTQGSITVSSGGVASNVAADDFSARLYILTGGTALDCAAILDGTISAASGATISGGTVRDWATVDVAAGGTITGHFVALGEGKVISGGVDVTEQYRE